MMRKTANPSLEQARSAGAIYRAPAIRSNEIAKFPKLAIFGDNFVAPSPTSVTLKTPFGAFLDTGKVPYHVELTADYGIVTPEGAIQRGWTGGKAPDPVQVESWVQNVAHDLRPARSKRSNIL